MKMKRNWMYRAANMAVALVLALGMAACSDSEETDVTPGPAPKDPSVSLREVQTTTTTAVVQVETKEADVCYIDYVVKGEVEPTTAEEIIASGEQFEAMSGNYTLQNLEPETNYVVLAAVRQGDKSATARLELTTEAEEVEGAIELNLLIDALYSTNNTAGNGNYEIVLGNTTELAWEGDVQLVLDLYNEPDADPINAVLPNGVYEPTGDYAPFTYNPSYTYASIVVGGELLQEPIMGTVTVDRKGAEYTILVDGVLFSSQTPIKLIYKGPIQFVQTATAEWERFDSSQEVTFEESQGRYWGNWFYPFADDLGIEFFQGEFDENGTLVKGYYLHLTSLYMPKLSDYNAQTIEIANGVYTVVPNRPDYIKSYALPFTFDYGQVSTLYEQMVFQGTYVTYVDKAQNINLVGIVADGTITVSGSGADKLVEFDFVTEEGISIKGSYQGNPNLGNYNDNDQNYNWASRPWTSLTTDHTYEWKPETTASAFLLGDYIKEGLDNWMVMIMAMNSEYPGGYGDFFTTELLVPSTNGFEFPTGTFNIGLNLEPQTMLTGYMDYSGIVSFTYYGDLTPDVEGYSTHSVAIEEGTVTISREGDEYKFVFNMMDGLGNKITGEWQGAVMAEDLRDAMGNGGEDDDHDHGHTHAVKQALRARR